MQANNVSAAPAELITFDYVDEGNIDKDLLCSVCYSPFVDPIVHQQCGNTFCKKCILSLEAPTCPLCRGHIQNAFNHAPRIILNQLGGLKVRCKNCSTTVRRDKNDEHIHDVLLSVHTVVQRRYFQKIFLNMQKFVLKL